ncbi:hypothetical protein J6590_000704 [Homalodisca vitripennis]|nr:hypothetical protein J6590_000704 [Homalodisca vitripennis]
MGLNSSVLCCLCGSSASCSRASTILLNTVIKIGSCGVSQLDDVVKYSVVIPVSLKILYYTILQTSTSNSKPNFRRCVVMFVKVFRVRSHTLPIARTPSGSVAGLCQESTLFYQPHFRQKRLHLENRRVTHNIVSIAYPSRRSHDLALPTLQLLGRYHAPNYSRISSNCSPPAASPSMTAANELCSVEHHCLH